MVSYRLQYSYQHISGDITNPVSCTVSPAVSQNVWYPAVIRGGRGGPMIRCEKAIQGNATYHKRITPSVSPTVYRVISLHIVFHIIRYRHRLWYAMIQHDTWVQEKFCFLARSAGDIVSVSGYRMCRMSRDSTWCGAYRIISVRYHYCTAVSYL